MFNLWLFYLNNFYLFSNFFTIYSGNIVNRNKGHITLSKVEGSWVE
jgi:hypothetical protein